MGVYRDFKLQRFIPRFPTKHQVDEPDDFTLCRVGPFVILEFIYRDYIGIAFPFSLLTTTELRVWGFREHVAEV